MKEKAQRLNRVQKVFIVKTFYETSNKSETCRLFEGKFQRNIKRDTVSKLIKRLEDTGSTDDLPRSGRPVNACSQENREIILGAFSLNPTKSTRRISMELNMSRTSIRRLLGQSQLADFIGTEKMDEIKRQSAAEAAAKKNLRVLAKSSPSVDSPTSTCDKTPSPPSYRHKSRSLLMKPGSTSTQEVSALQLPCASSSQPEISGKKRPNNQRVLSSSQNERSQVSSDDAPTVASTTPTDSTSPGQKETSKTEDFRCIIGDTAKRPLMFEKGTHCSSLAAV